MSKPRRRKQKKQVKAELKLRQFAATELSDQLAALHFAADLPRFMVDTVAGAYAPADAELMIEGFGAAATRPVTLRANTLKATAEDIAAALDAAGIAHRCRMVPGRFILPEAQVSDLWDLDIYRDGKIYLQSLSSMMPPLVWAHRQARTSWTCAQPPAARRRRSPPSRRARRTLPPAR